MKLNELRDNPGATHARKRVGRGVGSGLGKTSGGGQKGQKSRSGVSIRSFEGGQMPIERRLPKRGFNKPNRAKFAEVNLGRLQQAVDAGKLDAGAKLDAASLCAAGVIRRPLDGVRLLGVGELKAKIDITVAGASKSAVEAVEKAGGSVTLIERKPKPEPKKGPKGKAAKKAAGVAAEPAAKAGDGED
jgi:large subunit ribosomal protein L15